MKMEEDTGWAAVLYDCHSFSKMHEIHTLCLVDGTYSYMSNDFQTGWLGQQSTF